MGLTIWSPFNRFVRMTTIDIQELSPDAAEAVKRALARGEEVFITEKEEKRFAKVVLVHDESDSPPQSRQETRVIRKYEGTCYLYGR